MIYFPLKKKKKNSYAGFDINNKWFEISLHALEMWKKSEAQIEQFHT